MALFLYPGIAPEGQPPPYFAETYFSCVAASAALSLIAHFLGGSGWLHLVLVLRCYFLVVLGYSIEGQLSVKLTLGIGLLVETCLIEEHPFDLLLAAPLLAALLLSQAFPGFLGPSALRSGEASVHPEELAVLALALACPALAARRIRLLDARRRELCGLVRIHEANLDALAELNRNLQGYARTVDEESAERERNRISREIHDISGYIFTNLIALMDAAGSMPRGDKAGVAEILVAARGQAQEGLRETRAALRKLRDEHAGLTNCAGSIHKIVTIFSKVTGVEVKASYGNLPQLLPRDCSLALYRTIQEGLTNAVRHGKATRVRVGFWVADGEIRLSIVDNGKGAYEIVKGIGLRGMEERIGALGGRVGFGQAAEGGFSLSIDLPLPERVQGAGQGEGEQAAAVSAAAPAGKGG